MIKKGVQCLYGVTKMTSIVWTVTLTSVRKVLSILLSFLIFPKPTSLRYFFGIFLVFLGFLFF
jgi:drug/metabolite transporter (DMT)-like permease